MEKDEPRRTCQRHGGQKHRHRSKSVRHVVGQHAPEHAREVQDGQRVERKLGRNAVRPSEELHVERGEVHPQERKEPPHDCEEVRSV